MTAEATLPSRALDAATWERAANRLVETTRDLIRIPSVNPPLAEAPDYELVAARHIADLLRDAGLVR